MLYLAAKQQKSWVVSLWWSPLTFVWPGVPKDCWMGLIGTPSDSDRIAIWQYLVSMRLQLATLLYSWINAPFYSSLNVNLILLNINLCLSGFLQDCDKIITTTFDVWFQEPSSSKTKVNLCQKIFFLQNMVRTCCVEKLFWMSETISVRNMFSPGLSLKFSRIELVIQWTKCRHIEG